MSDSTDETSEAVMTALEQAIKTDDTEQLQVLLQSLGLEQLSAQELKILLVWLAIVSFDSAKSLDIILLRWEDCYLITNSIAPPVIELLVNLEVGYESVLDKVLKLRPGSLLSILLDFSNSNYARDIKAVAVALTRLGKLFTDPEDWFDCDKQFKKASPIARFLKQNARTPTYIRNFEEYSKTVPTDIQLQELVNNFGAEELTQIPATEVVASIIQMLHQNQVTFKSSTGEAITDSELAEFILRQYELSTSREKLLLASSTTRSDLTVTSESARELLLFRVFGPMNNTTDCSDNMCSNYGCRMFLCNEYDDMPEFDILAVQDQPLVWFTGICGNCARTIPYKHYAVRLPLNDGGWRGCYCCWKCAAATVTDPVILLSIGRIKGQLLEIGIQDRSYSITDDFKFSVDEDSS